MDGLKRALGTERLEMTSPLPVEECIRRLDASVDGRWSISGTHPVIGSVSDGSFRLRKRLIGARNSFQTYLRGKIETVGGATRIRCRLGMHPFVAAFMVFWLAMVCVFAIVFPVVFMNDRTPDGFIPALIPLFMLVFGVGLVIFGRRMASGERDFLIGFLRDVIEARVTGTSVPETAKTVERSR